MRRVSTRQEPMKRNAKESLHTFNAFDWVLATTPSTRTWLRGGWEPLCPCEEAGHFGRTDGRLGGLFASDCPSCKPLGSAPPAVRPQLAQKRDHLPQRGSQQNKPEVGVTTLPGRELTDLKINESGHVILVVEWAQSLGSLSSAIWSLSNWFIPTNCSPRPVAI